MYSLDILSIVLLLIPSYVHAGLGNLLKFEDGVEDVLKPKQPFEIERKGRFIRFDAKDTEIELELGVSVPFLKIPLRAGLSHEPGAPPHDNRVTVNTAGVLVGATLLITSFLLVPLVLPQHGHGRSEEKRWDFVSEVNQILKQYQLDMGGCSKKALCEMVSGITQIAGNGPLSLVIDNAIRSETVANAFGNVSNMEPVRVGQKGDCESTYTSCFLNRHHLAMLPPLLGV